MKKKHSHFIPRADAELARWLNNFKEKIAVLGAALGLTPAQIAELQDIAQSGIDTLNKVTIKTKEKEEAVKAKNLMREEQLQELVDVAIGFKRNKLFTENMGNELGIYSAAVSLEKSILMPSVKLEVYSGSIDVIFKKHGQVGVGIFSRLKSADEWEFVCNTTTSPYSDIRPLAVAGKAEIREYMVKCWDGIGYIGQNSDSAYTAYAG